MINRKLVLSILPLLLILFTLGCSKSTNVNGPSQNNAPTVSLTADPSSGNMPLAVQFTANASDNDGNVVKYEYDFDNDGIYDTAISGTIFPAIYPAPYNPNHTYYNSGTYNPKVKVTDDDGSTAEATTQIVVNTPVTPPQTVKTISFTPSGSPIVTSVYLSQVSANNDEITLSINVKGATNVHGAVIEINFDGSKISYISASKGDFLGQGGTNTIFSAALEQGNNGVLLIGVDRTGTATGVNGDGILANIVLKALAAQTSTSINFNTSNCALKLPANSGNIAGVSSIGGNLSYQ